jgi:hypothetical protein
MAVTLAREFDACGECRLDVGGPAKYRNLTNEEIIEVVEALERRPGLRTEAWMVIQKRTDGALPDPVKMSYVSFQQGLHFVLEDGLEALGVISRFNNLPNTYGLFRIEIEVMEEVK